MTSPKSQPPEGVASESPSIGVPRLPRSTWRAHSSPSPTNLDEASLRLVRKRFYQSFLQIDPNALPQRIKEKPELIIPLLNTFTRFGMLQLARDKFNWRKAQAEKRRAEREAKLRRRKPILLTPEVFTHLEAMAGATPVAPPFQSTSPGADFSPPQRCVQPKPSDSNPIRNFSSQLAPFVSLVLPPGFGALDLPAPPGNRRPVHSDLILEPQP